MRSSTIINFYGFWESVLFFMIVVVMNLFIIYPWRFIKCNVLNVIYSNAYSMMMIPLKIEWNLYVLTGNYISIDIIFLLIFQAHRAFVRCTKVNLLTVWVLYVWLHTAACFTSEYIRFREGRYVTW